MIVRVLRRVSDHYATRTKKPMTEQYFGRIGLFQTRIFDTAVFCDPLKKRSCEYTVDERCHYRCSNGLWSVSRHSGPFSANKKLEALLKTVDAVMREEYAYKHPVKQETDTKWLLSLIREETQALLSEKKAKEAKRITIDYSKLTKIRQDADITRDKLAVDEELEYVTEQHSFSPEPEETSADTEHAPESPLTETEYRLLHCLLYGSGIGWIRQEGHLLSVLVDGINEKLYDIFMDSVLDDTPELVEDYIDDLKEMVPQ